MATSGDLFRIQDLRFRCFGVLVALLIGGCVHSRPNDRTYSDGSLVSTDKRLYFAEPFHYSRPFDFYRYRASVVTRFRNPLHQAVFLYKCMPNDTKPMYELRRLSFTDRFDAGVAWACVGHSRHFVIMPGESRVDTIVIEGPSGWSNRTGVGAPLEGTFQIGLMIYPCLNERCVPIDSIRFSNSFEVRHVLPGNWTTTSMAGCYRLAYNDWDDRHRPLPPPRFRLYEKPFSRTSVLGANNVRPVVPMGGDSRATWVQQGDTTIVTWAAGLDGIRLHLAPKHGFFAGDLELLPGGTTSRDRFTDAVARRVECDRTFQFEGIEE